MKERWTYKKLGEVTFYPKDRISLSEITADRYVGVENLVKDKGGVEFSIYYPNSESAIEFTIDDILIGNIRPYLKKIWLADRHGGASGDVIIVRISTGYKSCLKSDYLFKVLSSDKFFEYDNAYTHGAKMPRGDKKAISEYLIPIPPLPTQQSIVSELDKINELIALKKSQLKDLDTLAQSIFYEMFGDPITNEKGWEVKKVIDVVKLQRGFDLPVQNRLSSGNIPIYGSNGIVGYHTVSKASYGIITGRSGSIGEVFMCDKPFWPLNTSLFSVDCHGNNILYLKFLMQSYHLERFKQGAGVPTLNRNSFHSNDIIDVPLSLQHQFAERVESIERMKQQVQTAIKDLETLLASRMQYWFD